ncbi:MAG: transporter [Gammaproteobacteria bacterium]|nr:transporter [Gammaproteobacteria bacterium]
MKRYVIAALAGVLLGAAPGADRSAFAAEAGVTIPATSTAIWQAVDTHLGALRALVAKNELATVHEHAFAVRDLVRALPSRSPGLSEEAKAQVAANVRFVDTLSARLDASGDAKDKPGTEASLRKLEGVLKQIRVKYPEGAN